MSLERMLRSSDMAEHHQAMQSLLSMPRETAVRLMDELAREQDQEFRSQAIAGMAKVSPEHGKALALQFLSDPDPDVRVNSIDALRRLVCHDATERIASVLEKDADDLVRSWAAFALGEIGDESVLPILIRAAQHDTGTDHEGRTIRETALGSIKMIKAS